MADHRAHRHSRRGGRRSARHAQKAAGSSRRKARTGSEEARARGAAQDRKLQLRIRLQGRSDRRGQGRLRS